MDLVRRARGIFEEVVVAVAHNPAKKYLFDLDQRVELARSAVEDLDVRVAPVQGLLADYCRQVGANAIVKGLRGGADFDAEQPMALMNRHLSGVETIFLVGEGSLAHIASSLVKDIASHGGHVNDLVPPAVAHALRHALPPGGSR